MWKIARFIAYLGDRVIRARPGRVPKIVRDAVWRCHQAGAGRAKEVDWDLTASQTIQEAYAAPWWQFVAYVLAVAHWTASASTYDTTHAADRMAQKEKIEHGRTAAMFALELSQELGIDSYDLAELYLGMQYGTDIHPDRKDAALAALVAGHTEVADDIICRP